MRPGKQLFSLNYNNIIKNTDIKNNIKAIKIIIRETYGGNRTYINQIMFYEQNAEQVKDLICGNELNRIYKNQKKLIEKYSNNQLNQKFNNNNLYGNIKKSKNSKISDINNLNEEYMKQYSTQNNNKKINKNRNEKINNKNYYTEIENEEDKYKEKYKKIEINNDDKKAKYKEEESDEEELNGINVNLNKKNNIPNNKKYHKINNNKKDNKKRNNKKNKLSEISSISSGNKPAKSEIIKDNNKIYQKESLEGNNERENLTPNKYLKRIKSLTNGNNTLNITPNLNINLSKNISSIPNNADFPEDNKDIENNNDNMLISPNRNNIYKNKIQNSSTNNFYIDNLPDEQIEKYQTYEERMYLNPNNLNSIYSGNRISSYSLSKSRQMMSNINLNNYENEENHQIEDNNQRMYNTYKNMLYPKRNNLTGINNEKQIPSFITNNISNNESIYSNQNENEQNKGYEENYINNNNKVSPRKNILKITNINTTNNSQRFSVRSNYENAKSANNKLVKEKLDYLEANVIEIKKEINLISERLSFFNSKEFLINNFKDQILDICEEIYNENYYNQKNISIISNSNLDNSQDKNNDFILENEINKKLDEKLGNIKNNLFDKFLQPKIEEIGNSMKKNIEKIKSKVDDIGNSLNKQKYNFEKSEGDCPYFQNDDNYDEMIFQSSSKLRNEKFDEINRIGEKLYNKLLEKEKKLKLLKLEKTRFLNEENEKDNIDVKINY